MSKRLNWEDFNRRHKAQRVKAFADDTDRMWKQKIRKAQDADKLHRLASSLARQRELRSK